MATISSVVFNGKLEAAPRLTIVPSPGHTRSALCAVILPDNVRVRIRLSGVAALAAASFRAGEHVGVLGRLAADEEGLYVESESMVRRREVMKGMALEARIEDLDPAPTFSTGSCAHKLATG